MKTYAVAGANRFVTAKGEQAHSYSMCKDVFKCGSDLSNIQ
jgi:hypothetical protein